MKQMRFHRRSSYFEPSIQPAALHYACRQTQRETTGMYIALDIF